ncbi:rhodanese-like domain-containing protein [Bacillus tuaregi]|uniref:rhodanese-like domain-containing protein n=1 Tax=Bacillus tuaregi TaxID=1816695 RepID=UPI0008F8D721|nr:rhodanese-like domain-containing protein [Bacillus tuaregi]
MSQIAVITTNELMEKLEAGEKLELVDVREHDEVAMGMIPGAKHIPMGDIPASLGSFDKDKEYIMVCRSGSRSAYVCEFMQAQGYKVRNMTGGMLDWRGKTE